MIVLFFNEFYAPYKVGGAEVSTQLLAENLVQLGIEVHVCTSGNVNESTMLNGVGIHRISQSNFYWSYEKEKQSTFRKALWHIKECYNIDCKKDILGVIEKINPDIIHTSVISGFSVLVWEIAHNLSIPIVHTLRDYYLMCYRSTLYNKERCIKQCVVCNLTSIIKKKYSRYVNVVIGISKYILKRHLDSGYFKNTQIRTVVPNSVRSPQNPLMKIKPKVIGFLGRVHPSKGVELLIESFLAIDCNDYVLQIAGSGDKNYIDALSEKYVSERVIFLGKVDTYSFLNKISLLVVPSLWDEPFGRVIIEANVCNVPVLVSNRGGMSELIAEGVNGDVFKLEEKNDLKKKLMDFMNGKQTYNLSEMLLEEYTEKSIANKYLEIYSQILNK